MTSRSLLVRAAGRLLPKRLRQRLRTLPLEIGYRHGPMIMSTLRKWWVLVRHPHAHIRFGNGVYLGPRFSLHIPGPGTFIVGDGVEFRRNFRCEIYDGNHRYRDLSRPFLEQGFNFRAIRIDDDAQIHSLCTIINDIGERAVIGANAVVTRPIPPFTLAVGAPARPISYFGPPGLEPDGWAGDEIRDDGSDASLRTDY